MSTEMICIVCPMGCHLSVDDDLNVTGNTCPRGAAYAKTELTDPTRTVTTTVEIEGAIHPRLPVITDKPIKKGLMMDLIRALNDVKVQAPVQVKDVIVPNVLGTDVNVVASRSMPRIKK